MIGPTDVPDGAVPVEEEPYFPDDAGGATQNMAAVGSDDATQAVPRVSEEFGGRPMFRDEAPPSGANATAEIDLSGLDDYDDEPPRRRAGSGSRTGTGTKVLIGVGFVALLAAGGGGAFLLANGGGEDEAGLSSGGTSTPPETPAALESGGLFPESLTVEGTEYELALVDDTEDCATVGQGSYGGVLEENGCRQVIRATYVDADGAVAVTAGVAAMDSAEQATAALEAQDLGANQWFAGLKGKEGSGAEQLDRSAGQGSGGQWGPYLLFSLAANSDGSAPGEGGADLEKVGGGFVDTTLNSLAEQAAE
ncbi:hypothetical protein [Nocardiopsis potens]|uniref:hypothetical protein n=1 Tax=Nocardiopsis potens TaxID=1246458 RepID=UPI00034752C7|nr:hypothetical protein [Nocardiopsis potens]